MFVIASCHTEYLASYWEQPFDYLVTLVLRCADLFVDFALRCLDGRLTEVAVKDGKSIRGSLNEVYGSQEVAFGEEGIAVVYVTNGDNKKFLCIGIDSVGKEDRLALN